jgi:hypothetical protein
MWELPLLLCNAVHDLNSWHNLRDGSITEPKSKKLWIKGELRHAPEEKMVRKYSMCSPLMGSSPQLDTLCFHNIVLWSWTLQWTTQKYQNSEHKILAWKFTKFRAQDPHLC